VPRAVAARHEHERSRSPREPADLPLHWQRDLEAEQRRAAARESLIEILAEAVVHDILREQAAGQKDSGTT